MGVLVRIPKDAITLTGAERVSTHVLLRSKQLSSAHESSIEIQVADVLKIQPKDIYKYITVELGSTVAEGDCIAQKSGVMRKSCVRAPHASEVRKIDHVDGTITLVEKTSVSHSFSVSGIWKGIEGNEVILELHDGVAVPIVFALNQSFSAPVMYCDSEVEIDETVTGAIVVTLLTSSVAISRICAFDPQGIVTLKVPYHSQVVPQLTVVDPHDMDTIFKKQYNTLLYIVDRKVMYLYKSKDTDE